MTARTILLDGDIVAYQYASSAERPINWGNGLWTLHAFEEDAIPPLDNYLAELTAELEADRLIVCLTDGENWRKSVLPTYKANRADVRKPMLLPVLRQHLLDNHETFLRPSLEGDDIIGILATGKVVDGEKVIVTIDKDMKTIPGIHYHMRSREWFTVTPEEAHLSHMLQTLTGDTTDGYTGCPGIGPVKARSILQADGAHWPKVVKAYEKAGLGEEEALRQARVARICWAQDYDFKKKQVKLWTP